MKSSTNEDLNLTFKKVLSDTENKLFVGRGKEIEIFKNCLENPSYSKRILNIYATGGMGKSFLLDQYQRISVESNARFILMNSRDFAHSPQHMMHRIFELLDGQLHDDFSSNTCIRHINLLAKEQQIILAFDTYEE